MLPKKNQSTSSPRQVHVPTHIEINDFRNTQLAIEECRRRCRVSYREQFTSQPRASPRQRKTSEIHPKSTSQNHPKSHHRQSSHSNDSQDMRQSFYGDIEQSQAFDQGEDCSMTSDFSEEDERTYNFKMFLDDQDKENRPTTYR